MEYAIYLGMDPLKDKQYFWIAKEGLKSPLPQNWRPYRNRNGEILYYNIESNEFITEHPSDQYYMALFKEQKQKKNPLKPTVNQY